MRKELILIGIMTLLFAIKPAFAYDYGCNGQYGQYGSNCNPTNTILIDKTVGKPLDTKGSQTTVQYVDNLSASDYKFKPEDTVYFQIKVKNTSNTTLENVVAKDILPDYLDALEGPGAYDKASKVITINVGSLQPSEEKVYTLKTVVLSQANLPADKSLLCTVNKASVSANNAYDDDTAQLCIEKQVLGVTSVPSTGPEMGLALLAGEAMLLGAGVFLKRKLS